MSNCELTLTFERSDATYHFGDTVSGAVEVHVASKCVCRRLVVELEWRTHGRGSQDWGLGEVLTLFEGAWEPQWVYRYPFNFTAPNGPATYHGHNLNVDWYVRARVDNPGLSYDAVEHEILLIPPDPFDAEGSRSGSERTGSIQVNLGPAYQAPFSEWIRKKVTPGTEASYRAAWSFLVAPFPLVFRLIPPPFGSSLNPVEMIFGVVGLFVLMESLQLIIGDWRPRIGSMKFLCGCLLSALLLVILLVLAQYSFVLADIVFGAIMSLLGLYLLFKSRRQRALGQILVNIWPTVIRRTRGISCEIQFKRFRTGIRPLAWATLVAREYALVSWKSGGVFIPCHLAYEKTCSLVPASSISSRDTVTLQTLIAIPADVPLTFAGWSNALAWEVALGVSVNGVPAWNASYPVTVRP